MDTIKVTTRILGGFLLALGLICGGCASTSGEDEAERLYTPVALYFNPLEYICPYEWVKYFPIFENYPDDWAKYGLKGTPLDVHNEFKDVSWGVSYKLIAIFDQDGKLYSTLNTAWKFGNRYIYDSEGLLQEIIRYDDNNSYHSEDPLSSFKYDGKRLEEWRGPSGTNRDLFQSFQIKAYRYEYYPDSTLKSVMPVLKGDISGNSTTGTYEFNEKGQLVRMTAPNLHYS